MSPAGTTYSTGSQSDGFPPARRNEAREWLAEHKPNPTGLDKWEHRRARWGAFKMETRMREKVKSGEWTVKQAREWLLSQDYVNAKALAWLNRMK